MELTVYLSGGYFFLKKVYQTYLKVNNIKWNFKFVLFIFMFFSFSFSYGQYISTQSTSYNGNIYHMGGYIGIGTSNPQKDFEIFNTGNPTIRLTTTCNKCDITRFFWDIEHEQDTKNLLFQFGTLNTPITTKMILDTNGRLILGSENIIPSAILQIESPDKGILIPRMAESDIKQIKSPVNGLLVFNKDIGKFEYYFGTTWYSIINDADIVNFLTKQEFYNTVAGGITSNDTSRWNEAYNWGNHAEAGYLKEESDPIFSSWNKDYNDLINRPDFSSWDTLAADDFDGLWSSLRGDVPGVSIFPNDAGYLTEADVNQIWTKDSNKVYLENNDIFVGIGTDQPIAKLHIFGDNKKSSIILEYYSKEDKNKGIQPPDPSVEKHSLWEIQNDGDLLFNLKPMIGDWNTKVIFNSTGINVNGRVDAKEYYKNGQPIELSVWKKNNENIFYNDGNVGIGIDKPSAKLHIKNGSLLIDGEAPYWTNVHWTKRVLMPLGSAWVSTQNVTGTDYKLGFGITNLGWYFIEGKDDGDVRYPAYLKTDGTFVCSKVKVIELPQWHDDVFDPDYNLMPINELEQYLLQNRHLPDIPSEDSLKQNGLDLSQMQALQLKKIEELTLYIIQLDQRLTQLEYENKLLKQELNLQKQSEK